MNKNSKLTNQERREFIKKASLAGAGVAASALISTEVLATHSGDQADQTSQKGYHVTQHVLDYYKSAGI